MGTLDELMTGWRGYTSGVTAGLHRYPAAVVMMAMDKLVGADAGPGGGKLSYKEALQAIRDLEAGDIENNPKAALAGNIIGAMATAPIAGGAGVARSALNAGILGGTSGFTANAGMDNAVRDTAVGVGLGGTLGALGGVAQKGINAATGWVTNKWATEVAGRATAVRDAAEAEFSKLVKHKGNIREKVEEILSGTRRASPEQVAAAKKLNDANNATRQWEQRAAVARGEQPQTAQMNPKDTTGMLFSEDLGTTLGLLRPVALQGIGAGTAAGTIAAATGNDPWQAAMWGAGGTTAANMLRSQIPTAAARAVAAMAARVPQGGPLTVARVTTRAGVEPAQALMKPLPIETAQPIVVVEPEELAPWEKPKAQVPEEKAPWER
jgi:hypothetical protein